MAILVFAEHHNGEILPATRAAIGAAKEIASHLGGSDIHLLLAGHALGDLANKAAAIEGVDEVLVEDDTLYAHPLPEALAPFITQFASGHSHVLAAATSLGKDVLPRVAALLDVQQISEITAVVNATTFIRPIYAGNALETVTSHDNLQVLTVRATAFLRVAETGGKAGIVDVPAAPVATRSRFVTYEASGGDRPELTSARVVISGGRGIGSKENFALLAPLADCLNAAIGASRAAVDAGFVPNDYQVGQTGKIVAPELYIAVGISGAIQHLAGMKESKTIVAINKDENAPIFDVADYGLVADWFEAVPQLAAALQQKHPA